ncbi:hypothetical protein J6590_080218 [Homalodisca vitripennis]|nr:hypothetical protein J6590_080218 [Homalodisca vitripennis]
MSTGLSNQRLRTLTSVTVCLYLGTKFVADPDVTWNDKRVTDGGLTSARDEDTLLSRRTLGLLRFTGNIPVRLATKPGPSISLYNEVQSDLQVS